MKDISADETNVSLGTLLLKDFCKGELTGVKAGKLNIIYIYSLWAKGRGFRVYIWLT